jgi:glucose uptake protein GlcU
MFMGTVGVWLATASTSILNGANTACGASSCNKTSIATIFENITNTLIFLVGAVAVIMIVVGGLRYVTSNGDSKRTQAAKDTIQYSVVGVVVAILSYAIVRFVANALK